MQTDPYSARARRAAAAGCLVALATAAPLDAQRVVPGFPRSDQSDVAGVSLTSSDLVNWEPGTARSFACTVAWGVRNAGALAEAELRGGAGAGAGAANGDLLHVLSGARGGGDEEDRIVAALTAGGNSTRATRASARRLVGSMGGLLMRTSRMDPARPGIAAPSQVNQAVSRYNDFVDASDLAFIRSQPAELRAIHAVLSGMANAAQANHGRAATPASAGGLACAPAAPPAAPAPPLAFALCMAGPDGPMTVTGYVDAATGDSTTEVGGVRRPLAGAYPATPADAAAAGWYARNEPITLRGVSFVRFGLPRDFAAGSLTRVSDFGGTTLYAPPGVADPQALFVPVGRSCRYHEYRRARDVVNVRG